MVLIYGIVNRLLVLATVSLITANAAPAELRCPQQCQCSYQGQDIIVVQCSDILLDRFPSDIPKTIKSLDVSSNSISIVSSNDLRKFPLLKYLDISSNNIQDILSHTFSALTLLEKLDLSFNKITSFNPNTFIHNRVLTHLSITGNPLHTPVDSPILTSDSLKTLELNLGTWSQHTFKNFTSLERLIVHWKNGISMNTATFEPLCTLRELNIICREVCEELPPDLKNYFTKSSVKLVYNRTAIKRMVEKKNIKLNKEDDPNQEITKTSSSPQQGAEEVQNDTPLINEHEAEIIPLVEEKISEQDHSITSSTKQESSKIEIESAKNIFSGFDSSTIPENLIVGLEIDKEQTPENNENKLQIHGSEIIFAASGVIVALMILILALGLCVIARWLRQNVLRTSHDAHVRTIPRNIPSHAKPAPQYEHVYDEAKDIDSSLFYHIYYDHNAPLLPHRPPVPPRPVGYYAIAYATGSTSLCTTTAT